MEMPAGHRAFPAGNLASGLEASLCGYVHIAWGSHRWSQIVILLVSLKIRNEHNLHSLHGQLCTRLLLIFLCLKGEAAALGNAVSLDHPISTLYCTFIHVKRTSILKWMRQIRCRKARIVKPAQVLKCDRRRMQQVEHVH